MRYWSFGTDTELRVQKTTGGFNNFVKERPKEGIDSSHATKHSLLVHSEGVTFVFNQLILGYVDVKY